MLEVKIYYFFERGSCSHSCAVCGPFSGMRLRVRMRRAVVYLRFSRTSLGVVFLMPRFLNAQYRLCILTESHRVPTHPHAQLVFSKPLKDWRAQCRPALDQRHRAKARASRKGRMIDLQIICPVLAGPAPRSFSYV